MVQLGARMSDTLQLQTNGQATEAGTSAVAEPAHNAAVAEVTASGAVPENAKARSAGQVERRRLMMEAHDLVDLATAGDPDQPWAPEDAEELTRLYEAGAAGLPLVPDTRWGLAGGDYFGSASPRALALASAPKPEPARQERRPATPPVEKKWLEDRFADVAARIERILVEHRQEAPFEAFDERFTHLEARFGEAVQDLAKRADVAGLGDVEACIAEMAEQLERTYAELSRVAEIEAQVRELAGRVSEERLSALEQPVITPVDVDEIASVVVQRLADQGFASPAAPDIDVGEIATVVAHRLAEQGFNQPSAPEINVEHIANVVVSRLQEEGGYGIDAGGAGSEPQLAELKTMVKGLVESRRDESEHTSTMLDTMQQAMIRLLDRMDALEDEATAAAPSAPVASVMPLAPAPVLGSATPADDRRFDAQQAASNAPPLMRGDPISDQEHEEEVRAAFGVRQSPEAAEPHHYGEYDEPEREPYGYDARDEHEYEPAEEEIEPEQGHSDRRHFMEAARRAAQQANQRAKLGVGKEDATAAHGRQAAYYDGPADEEEAPVETKSRFGGFFKRRVVVAAIAIILIGAGASAILMKVSGPVQRQLITQETERREMLGQNGSTRPAPVQLPVQTEPANGARPDGGKLKGSEVQPVGVTIAPTNAVVSPGDLERRDRHQQYAEWSGSVGARMPTAQNVPASLIPSANEPQVAPPVTAEDPAGKRSSALPPALVGPLSLRIAAANGDPSAEFEVGSRFAEGKGVQQNFKQAITWYRRAATRGFALAQYRLATLYERGLGVDKDLQRAKIWYDRAASQGSVKAMHNLAVLAASSEAGSTDYGSAARWFKEAASRGLGDSQFNLAILYQSGLGVERDLGKSYTWFGIAARSGDKSASQRQAQIASQMKATEIAAADREISTWRKKSTSRLANDPRYAGEQWKQRKTSKN